MDARAMYFPISSLSFHKPITVETGRSVSDVILCMQEGDPHHERGTGCILVVEEKKLVGIVTERDLMQKVIGRNLNSDQIIVDEIMTESPDSLMIDDPIAFALNIMHFDKCRHVPLVDENQVPVGIVSSKDIVAYSAESLKMVTNQADGDE